MPYIGTSDRIKLYYEDERQGQPILLIHGWLISSQSWRRQKPVLSKARRLISLDMRSHGKSDPPNFGHRISRGAKDLYDLLDALNLEEVTAVGWSMGATHLMSYYDLFGAHRLNQMLFVDRTPKMFNQDGWSYGYRRMTPSKLADKFALIGNNSDSFFGIMAKDLMNTLPPTEIALFIEDTKQCPLDRALTLCQDQAQQIFESYCQNRYSFIGHSWQTK